MLLAVTALLALAGAPGPARAAGTTTIVSDQPSCVAAGGTFTPTAAGGECQIDSYTVAAGDTLDVRMRNGMGINHLTVSGTLLVNCYLDIQKDLTNNSAGVIVIKQDRLGVLGPSTNNGKIYMYDNTLLLLSGSQSSLANNGAIYVGGSYSVISGGDKITGNPPVHDTTAPTASPTQFPPANASGWNNTDVTISWNWADNGSGIDPNSCPATSISSGEGAGIRLTANCSDLVGNTGSASDIVKVDKTPPSLTITAKTADGSSYTAGTWTNQDVIVSFNCSDTLSGVSGSCPADQTFSSDGTATAKATVSDQAGNRTSASFGPINISKIPLAVVATTERAADSNGWYNHAVKVTFTPTGGAGNVSCDAAKTYSGPDSATASVTGSCTDQAGVVVSATATFKYDATAPTNVLGTPSRAANANGWYNAPVTVNFTGTDATSGITSCMQGASYSGPDSASATVPGTCTDNAGNVGHGSFTLKYDATKPTVAYSGNAGTYTADQTINITCTPGDATSGIASSTCANISGAAYTFKVGANTYSATATDKAGNVDSGSTSFTVTVNATSINRVIDQLVTNQSVAASLKDHAQAIAAAPNANAKAGKLNAFINAVNAQTGKSITPTNAAILITLAKAL